MQRKTSTASIVHLYSNARPRQRSTVVSAPNVAGFSCLASAPSHYPRKSRRELPAPSSSRAPPAQNPGFTNAHARRRARTRFDSLETRAPSRALASSRERPRRPVVHDGIRTDAATRTRLVRGRALEPIDARERRRAPHRARRHSLARVRLVGVRLSYAALDADADARGRAHDGAPRERGRRSRVASRSSISRARAQSTG